MSLKVTGGNFMKKRLLSFLTALVMTAVAMPLYANASDYKTYTNIEDGLKDYTLVSEHLDISTYSRHYGDDCVLFKNADGMLLILSPLNSVCYVCIKDESKTNEIVDIIKYQLPDAKVDMNANGPNCIRVYSNNNITKNEAQKLCSVLSEKGIINNFEYMCDRFYVAKLESDDIDNAYRTSTDGLGNIIRTLNTQLYDGIWQVSEVLYDNTSNTEPQVSYDTALHINTEAVVPYFVPTSSTKSDTSVTTLLTTVQGDANCDGRIDMSDAVLIMQTIANPSKYKLTEQGSKNADMDGDGVTNADALAIQKKLLKLD